MNKKILIGSIGAVIILVLVSFTGVVGYQTTKSTTITRVSPLFKVRTNRAIGEESKEISCKYVGKGNTLPFPERDDKTVVVQKVVDSIRKMDDEAFEKFIAYIINHVQKDKRFNDINPEEIRETFNLLRISDKPIPMFDAETNSRLSVRTCFTCTCPFTFGHGIKGILVCFIIIPLLGIYIQLLQLFTAALC
ncbi:MAG: hypothetical protein JSW06_09740 [Thermoplasmatales archaeon]|nr:MAG: hypothetical protein JSW06_09740 [Thermoplasmatales archaeon]